MWRSDKICYLSDGEKIVEVFRIVKDAKLFCTRGDTRKKPIFVLLESSVWAYIPPGYEKNKQKYYLGKEEAMIKEGFGEQIKEWKLNHVLQ